MRYLILTDIHANLEALETVLSDAQARGYDETLVLGDLVGYGADPNAVVERVRALQPTAIVRGNHDKVAFGLDQAEGFNTVARTAAQWTLEVLTPENREWVASLPQGPLAVDDLIEICHGAPYDEDAYIFDETDARLALKTATRPLCLFGHTHYPVAFELTNGSFTRRGPAADAEAHVDLGEGVTCLLNPGSVGQPRDGDPRAAWLLLDTDRPSAVWRRVEYDIAGAAAAIRRARLPDSLAERLGYGQ